MKLLEDIFLTYYKRKILLLLTCQKFNAFYNVVFQMGSWHWWEQVGSEQLPWISKLIWNDVCQRWSNSAWSTPTPTHLTHTHFTHTHTSHTRLTHTHTPHNIHTHPTAHTPHTHKPHTPHTQLTHTPHTYTHTHTSYIHTSHTHKIKSLPTNKSCFVILINFS